MFLVVNKAPSNIVDPFTGSTAVFSETGTYFLYFQHDENISYVSSLALPEKSVNVPIPGELTNIVGGYVGKERNEPLIDAVVPASSFEPYTTSPETYYEAPITLGFTPADGDLIRGTVNGVEVNGQWIGRSKYAGLYRVGDREVPFCTIGFHNEKAVISLEQDSAPTTDYELHLYRYVPAGIVQIPQEYVEGLEETTANASEALETATAAKSTAENILPGKTWTQSNLTSINSYAIYYADGIWVAGSNGNGLYYSTDGKTWTQSNLASNYNIVALYYADGIWVAGSNGNGLYYSTDGKTWTQSNLTSINSYAIYYADGIWVAGSYSHGLYYSTDGKTWTQSNITSIGINALYYADGIWVAGSYRHGLYYSRYKFAFTKTVDNEISEINQSMNQFQRIGDDVIINSSTPDSTKKFKITVDDTGTLSATEVT